MTCTLATWTSPESLTDTAKPRSVPSTIDVHLVRCSSAVPSRQGTVRRRARAEYACRWCCRRSSGRPFSALDDRAPVRPAFELGVLGRTARPATATPVMFCASSARASAGGTCPPRSTSRSDEPLPLRSASAVDASRPPSSSRLLRGSTSREPAQPADTEPERLDHARVRVGEPARRLELLRLADVALLLRGQRRPSCCQLVGRDPRVSRSPARAASRSASESWPSARTLAR